MMGIDDFATTVNLADALSGCAEPSPQCAFPQHSCEELDAFLGRADDAGLLTMEAILKGPLGLRMFSQWAASFAQGGGAVRAAAHFLVDVALLKSKNDASLHASMMGTYFGTNARVERDLPCDLRRAPRPSTADATLYKAHVQDAALLGLEGRLSRPSKAPSFRRETSIISRYRRGVSTVQHSFASRVDGVPSPARPRWRRASSRVPRRWRLGPRHRRAPTARRRRDAANMKPRRDKLPLVHGASLIAKNLPLQDQFNIIEDLMLAFCEKVALPCFLARDANPDLYAYLGYLKTQVEAKPCEEDFETIRVMGKGGFGLVKGCKTLRTGKMYALKEMDLKHVTKKKAKVLCDAEHACLTHPVVADSPFIVSLTYAFQSSTALCLVLDLMTGGDLSFHLDRAPERRFPEEAARYYAARTLLGLEALHDAGFV